MPTVHFGGKWHGFFKFQIQVFPAFWRFTLPHFALWKTTLLPAFANRKFWRRFLVFRKGAKAKIAVTVEAGRPLSCESGATRLSPLEPHSASSLYVCFITVCYVSLLARCVVRCQKSLREVLGFGNSTKSFPYKLMPVVSLLLPFQLTKGFRGTLGFLIARKTCLFLCEIGKVRTSPVSEGCCKDVFACMFWILHSLILHEPWPYLKQKRELWKVES